MWVIIILFHMTWECLLRLKKTLFRTVGDGGGSISNGGDELNKF